VCKNRIVLKQRRLYKARKKAGLCPRCGAGKGATIFCDDCAEKARIRYRTAYRNRVGILLGSPLRKTGRPRLEVNGEGE